MQYKLTGGSKKHAQNNPTLVIKNKIRSQNIHKGTPKALKRR